jgi:predicted ATP-grasp superfamily ATP-dependent carboligase
MADNLQNGRAIVTYGRSLMALTIAESLGSRSIEVIGCDDVGLTVLSFSRYAKHNFVHACAADEPERFIADLEAAILRFKPQDDRPYVLLPCFEETRIIARHAARLSKHITVAAPAFDAIQAVDPKDNLMRTVQRLGIKAPRTWSSDAFTRPDHEAVSFPLIAKPTRGVGGRGVHKIDDQASLDKALADVREPLLLQEFIAGQDYCLSALFHNGKRIASAAYRNLSQFPRSAGAGVLRETVPDAPFLPAADALFGALNWTGVLEADFRWDGAGEPYLIEVNPRFWAGLFHTVESGVDFPWMLYELFATGQVTAVGAPRLGQRTKVGGLYLLSVVQEVAESDVAFATAKAAWAQASHLFQSGHPLQASRELARGFAGGLGVGTAASRLMAALRSAKAAPNELFRSDDPMISLGVLFILASLMRYGRLPPELKYEAHAHDLPAE